MAEFTHEIYDLVNELTEDLETTDIFSKVDAALPQIFNFEYPIWSETYKRTLERKIILKYLTREICRAPFQLWQVDLYTKLNIIMPYYNQLYLSTIPEYDITKDHNFTITNTEELKNTTENTGTTTNATKNTTNDTIDVTEVDCNTPQARINNGDYASFIKENKGNNGQTSEGNSTLTLGTKTTTTNTRTNSTNQSGNNTYIADLIMRHRETLINIDNMIIEELSDLFMNIY